MAKRVSIHIVTWNHEKVISDLLRSIVRQTFSDYETVIIDNASADATLHNVRAICPDAAIVQNSTNRGFSAAHNQAIHMTESEYIVVVNPDCIFTDSALAILIKRLDEDQLIASISGKLLRKEGESVMIDCTGIIAKKSGQFLNRGEGEEDHGQYAQYEEVFGLSGACAVYRRKALETIRIGNEFFDEDFFAYKEDIDISWRLRYAGWKNVYDPGAIIYHSRNVRRSTTRLTTGRHKQYAFIKRISYRNHILLLVKNLRIREWFLPFPYLMCTEIMKLLYLVFREPSTALGFFDAIQKMKKMLVKRRITLQHAKVQPQQLMRWFV